MEAAALREAIKQKIVEDRLPYIRSFDVLIQYLLTLAVSEGFRPEEILPEIRTTFSFASISDDEWYWLLNFITTGGDSLQAYNEYRKVIIDQGIYKVENRAIAMRHRLSIGTIVGDSSMFVRFVSGKYLGTIEEYFISRLVPAMFFGLQEKILNWCALRKWKCTFESQTENPEQFLPGREGGCRCPLK